MKLDDTTVRLMKMIVHPDYLETEKKMAENDVLLLDLADEDTYISMYWFLGFHGNIPYTGNVSKPTKNYIWN